MTVGAEKIIEKISQDAAGAVKEISERAKADAVAQTEKTLGAARASADEMMKKAEDNAAEIKRRARLSDELTARKNTLAAKRAVVDSAFESAMEALKKLDSESWEKLITESVVQYALTGTETLAVPREDAPAYEKGMLAKLNAAMKAQGRRQELKTRIDENLRGGVIILGESADCDCSFETVIASFREQYEGEVASLLFGRG